MFQKSVSAQHTSGAPTHRAGLVPNQGAGKQSVLAPDDRGKDPLDHFETCPVDLEPRALVAGETDFLSTSVNGYIDWNLLHRHRFSPKNTVHRANCKSRVRFVPKRQTPAKGRPGDSLPLLSRPPDRDPQRQVFVAEVTLAMPITPKK